MKTKEEIAKEIVDKAVKPYRLGGTPYDKSEYGVEIEHMQLQWNSFDLDRKLQELKSKIEKLIIQGINKSLFCAVPGGLTKERIKEIWEAYEAFKECGNVWQSTHPHPGNFTHQLYEQIEHLTRCLHDCGEDGTLQKWGESYKLAFEAGAKAQKIKEQEIVLMLVEF